MAKSKSKGRKAPTAKQRANWARFARMAKARRKKATRRKAAKKSSTARRRRRSASPPSQARSAPVAKQQKRRKRRGGSARRAVRRGRSRRGGLSSIGRGFVPAGTVEAIAGTGLGMIASGIGVNKLAEKFPDLIVDDKRRMMAQALVGLVVAKYGKRVLGSTMARAFLVGSVVPAVVELGNSAISQVGGGGIGNLPMSPGGGRRNLSLAIA